MNLSALVYWDVPPSRSAWMVTGDGIMLLEILLVLSVPVLFPLVLFSLQIKLLTCPAERFIIATLSGILTEGLSSTTRPDVEFTMAPNPERRRHPRTKSFPDQRELTIICQAGSGRSMMAAKLLDFSEESMRVEIKSQLSEGSSRGDCRRDQTGRRSQPLDRQGFVRRCEAAGNGRFVAGLFLRGETTKTIPNYYEFLQISPNAEPATISRVYRFLASRFHPDIPGTGDAEKFVLLKQAYDVLSDPERRAEYDATYKKQAPEPVPLSTSVDFMNSSDGELNRRVAVLALLYIQRRIKPYHPGSFTCRG